VIEGHRAAFAAAWNECAVVRAYLEAVEDRRLEPSDGVTAQRVARPWCTRDSRRVDADPFAGWNLKPDVSGVADTDTELLALEDRFVAVAYHYGARHGICYAAWRAVGVDPTVLRRAGITAPR
jgi:hypothetical protein